MSLNNLLVDVDTKVRELQAAKADLVAKQAAADAAHKAAQAAYDAAMKAAGDAFHSALADVDGQVSAAATVHADAIKGAQETKAKLDALLRDSIPSDSNTAQAKVY